MNGGLAMFPIVATRHVARGIKLFEIKAQRIAKKQRPGQFVIVRLNDTGERIPLTLADANPEAGTITIVVQAIGKTTRLLNMLEAGDSILDVVAPLGKPSEIDNFGTAVVVSGSVGSAMAYPPGHQEAPGIGRSRQGGLRAGLRSSSHDASGCQYDRTPRKSRPLSASTPSWWTARACAAAAACW